MKYLFSSMLLLVFYTNSFAQVGVFGQYHSQSAPIYSTGNQTSNNDNINFKGGGIDYTFRLKNYRIEFFPALVFLSASSTYLNAGGGNDFSINFNTIGIQFNTHFYLFDIEGDCHCPTWSKEGTFFKKGFYLSASLNEYAAFRKIAKLSYDPLFYTALAIGVGLDIGISKHFTITPSIQYEIQQRKLMLTDFVHPDTNQYTVNNLIFELRLGYSFKDH